MVQSITTHTRCGFDFLDPSPASAQGLEVLSGKNDTTQMTVGIVLKLGYK